MELRNKENIVFIIKGLVFTAIFLVMFQVVDKVFLYKDANVYNYVNYMEQEPDSIDVLILGSSHSMDAIHSNLLSEHLQEVYGITAKPFNMSIMGMLIEQIDFRFEKALDTQKPKVLVIETFSFVEMQEEEAEAVRRRCIDCLPFSWGKWNYIERNISENQSSFVVPFIKYHSRWSELTVSDFEILKPGFVKEISVNNGFTTLAEEKPDYDSVPDDYFQQDFGKIDEKVAITDKQKRHVEHILEVAREHGIAVLFLSVPYKVQMDFESTELIKRNNFLYEKYVNNEDVFMLDLNKEANDIGWNYDYLSDDGHVNTPGRDKVTKLLAEYIGTNMKMIMEGK